jgi:ABC-type spermidine/putrescine transport system permease subunit II
MSRRFPRTAGAITAVVMVLLYAPIVVVLVYSVDKDPLLIHWRGFTMHWYSVAIHDPQVRSDFVTSVEVAAMSTALSLLIAITAGLWARGASGRGRRMLDSLTYARIILPEVVFALGLFVLMSKLGIGYGVLAIVAGHVVFNSAYATVIIQARLSTLGVSLEEAAADLGANRWRAIRRVTLPLLMPAIVVAGLLAISFSFDDVITSQFLGGSTAQTIPVLLLGMIRVHVTPEVNAIGAGLMLITLVTVSMAGVVAMLRPSAAGLIVGVGQRRRNEQN